MTNALSMELSVAPSSVVKWSQRLRATGSVAPGKIGGHVPPQLRRAFPVSTPVPEDYALDEPIEQTARPIPLINLAIANHFGAYG
jgi:hypothetical protein